jgi:RNA polymerase sigma factor (sigma-70 family)
MDEPTTWSDRRLAELLDRLCAAHRMDRRLQARVDGDDVRQEVMYRLLRVDPLAGRPLAVWEAYLRQTFDTAVEDLRRRHSADKRDLSRELREGDLSPGHSPDSTPQLAAVLHAHDTSPSQAAVRNEAEERLEAALSRLPVNQQRAFRLKRAGHGPTAIAEMMGLTPDAVTALIGRATLAVQHVIT